MKQTKHSIESHRYELVHDERCRLYSLSTEVWRRPLADGFNMDDSAQRVSLGDFVSVQPRPEASNDLR